MTEKITSLKNERVKYWRELLHKPDKSGNMVAFFSEGEHMVSEALQEKKCWELIVSESKTERFSALLSEAKRQERDIFIVPDHVMSGITDTRTPQGICCICVIQTPERVTGKKIVALERVQDPGNVGTILRTMDAFGYDMLLIDSGCADPYSGKASRASMGAVFRVPVLSVSNLNETLMHLRQEGCSVVAGELHGKDLRTALADKRARACILVGNEGAGLSEGILSCSDIRVKIPMPGRAESLNAAIAASILMYEMME